MDIFELQERCREIRKINEEKRKANEASPPPRPRPPPSAPSPPRGKWDFLKDHPRQWLSPEEFSKRYHAWNQKREEAELRRMAAREETWGRDPFAKRRRHPR